MRKTISAFIVLVVCAAWITANYSSGSEITAGVGAGSATTVYEGSANVSRSVTMIADQDNTAAVKIVYGSATFTLYHASEVKNDTLIIFDVRSDITAYSTVAGQKLQCIIE